MLYVEVFSGDRKLHSEIVSCGQKLSDKLLDDANRTSTRCQAEATEAELEAIRRYIVGVRMVPGRLVIWTGEDARFIIMNLDLHRLNAADMKRDR